MANVVVRFSTRKPSLVIKSGSRMPITRWEVPSDAAKKIWDQMEDDDKAKMLALSETRKPAAQSASSKFSVDSHTAADAPEADLDDVLIAMVTKHSNRSKPHSHPGDMRTVLSQPATTSKATVQDDEVKVNGHTCVRKAMSHDIQHSVSLASRKKKSSLIDRGPNGGIAGADTRIIKRHPHRTADIRGITVTAGAVAKSQRGDVILIMHQHACYHQQDKSIHSSGQLESFSNDVNDKSIRIPGGLQRVQTVDGCVSPLCVRDGLPHLGMPMPNSLICHTWFSLVMLNGIPESWISTPMTMLAISDNVDHADLFDACGDYKGCTEIDVSSADTWFDTVTPDQCTRAQMEDATITCSEHACHMRHLDNDDIADVLLVNDTEIIDPPSTVQADDDLPPAVISDTAPVVDDDDPAAASARTFKVQDRDEHPLGSFWFPCVHLVTLSCARCGPPESDLQRHPWWHST
jgi:hypothetical protein